MKKKDKKERERGKKGQEREKRVEKREGRRVGGRRWERGRGERR